MVSAIIITWNEEEMLGQCLDCLASFPAVKETIIIDSCSTDHTHKIASWHPIKPTFYVRAFDDFSHSRNFGIYHASQDWILVIDADETYSRVLGTLLDNLDHYERTHGILAWRIPTLDLFADASHFIDSGELDPHIRIFKRGFACYRGKVHAVPWSGEINLHEQGGAEVGSTWDFPELKNIYMLHHQLLKSERSLAEKGERMKELGLIKQSEAEGIKVSTDFWTNRLKGDFVIKEVPGEWR